MENFRESEGRGGFVELGCPVSVEGNEGGGESIKDGVGGITGDLDGRQGRGGERGEEDGGGEESPAEASVPGGDGEGFEVRDLNQEGGDVFLYGPCLEIELELELTEGTRR